MKKIFENKKVLIGLIVLALVAVWSWNYWKANKPIDIGNPKKGDFVKVGKMTIPRYNHEAILLDDGKVLILGGMTIRRNFEGTINKAEIYDPATMKFKAVEDMDCVRKEFNATKLNNGKVLITGGRNNNKSLKSTQLYDSITNKFEKGPDMNLFRESHTATLLNNGQVLISGGQELDLKRTTLPLALDVKQSEIYNPIANKFEVGPKINIPRFDHSAILLNDGRVLIVGGIGYKNKQVYTLSSAEIYDPKTNKFKLIGNMNIARKKANLFVLKNGNVLIVDGIGEGHGNSIFLKDIEMYNPKTNKFSVVAKRRSSSRLPAEVLLKNDKLLFTGGGSGVGLSLQLSNSSEIFDPITSEFITVKGMNISRTGHRGTLLKNGNVLITGRYPSGQTAELYIYEDKK